MPGYTCKIVIEDTHPPVWRRVIIPDQITFLNYTRSYRYYLTGTTFIFMDSRHLCRNVEYDQ
ncbi:plasmid pRiA4b ORF-3 family protein [Anaerostipes hadrus]|uniref:hypothetical protein n=1 Tax=Anaerostipes hadrus TaxID=649756 RepID=UPI0006C1BF10|nr:hypothetical protein [Anaerostipes hadrus]NSH00442.1 plasmid pRiA4b ORF-3 family protein [Anaerostipes hadrus]CUN84691.1 Uncharacterised protein [Anaerostipes hadrus]